MILATLVALSEKLPLLSVSASGESMSQWHEHAYGSELPEALRFATIYHSTASTSMTLSWILSDMVVSCEEMAHMITVMRSMGMDVLFGEGHQNPYQK